MRFLSKAFRTSSRYWTPLRLICAGLAIPDPDCALTGTCQTGCSIVVDPKVAELLEDKVRLLLGPVVLSRRRIAAPVASSIPVTHSVRGHQRHLSDGRTVWINPHDRGTGTAPILPRVYRINEIRINEMRNHQEH
jgi:hypothetical protein